MGPHAIDGIINLNKPHGKTSFQMVSLVRRLSGVRKVGHSGTLDPDATGVLPILVGQATKLAAFAVDFPKTYRAVVAMGRATTTYDSSGTVTSEGDVTGLTIERIEQVLSGFLGNVEQVPPMYSAVKYQGRPLYVLARAGREVPRKPRLITISRISIVGWDSPLLTIEVECSKGTYIRSLAHDVGQAIGCGAHVNHLVRLRSGPFDIGEAILVEQLEEGFRCGSWRSFLHPLDSVLTHLEPLRLDEMGADAVAHGCPLRLSSVCEGPDEEERRAYSPDGRFMAIIRFDRQEGLWRPKRVFM